MSNSLPELPPLKTDAMKRLRETLQREEAKEEAFADWQAVILVYGWAAVWIIVMVLATALTGEH